MKKVKIKRLRRVKRKDEVLETKVPVSAHTVNIILKLRDLRKNGPKSLSVPNGGPHERRSSRKNELERDAGGMPLSPKSKTAPKPPAVKLKVSTVKDARQFGNVF